MYYKIIPPHFSGAHRNCPFYLTISEPSSFSKTDLGESINSWRLFRDGCRSPFIAAAKGPVDLGAQGWDSAARSLTWVELVQKPQQNKQKHQKTHVENEHVPPDPVMTTLPQLIGFFLDSVRLDAKHVIQLSPAYVL